MGKRKASAFDTVYGSKDQVEKISKRKWHQPDKGKVPYSEVIEWIKTKLETDVENYDQYHLIVGTDSQKRSNKIRFVTVAALYREGKGAMYFYTSHLLPKELFGKTKHDKSRIYQEVDYSVDAATEILASLDGLIVPTVHADVSNKHKKEYTSDISDNIISYIKSYGFDPCIKPFSFAASSIANKHTKG
jgi:uncharacterized protein